VSPLPPHEHEHERGHDHVHDGHADHHHGGNDHHGAHAHHDGHAHHAPPERLTRAFAIGIALNLAFVAIESVAGVFANSLALIADAGHNLSDVLSLVLAWGAMRLARREPTPRRTYGFRRGTILASLVSSALLLVALGAIAWEALPRFRAPAPVEGAMMIGVAAAGVVINGITALLFASGRHTDLNVRAAFLHMVGDAAVSVAVVAGGIGVLTLGWLWLDPALSLAIVVVIVIATWGVLTESLDMAFDAVPRSVEPHDVRAYLQRLPGVAAIHDLHIWAMSTTETALTAHLVMPAGRHDDAFLRQVAQELDRRFRIAHTTLQVEQGSGPQCDQSC
jgi:cobalt-zinc-cadmium efflux system protein